ncbi:chemoreceptor glutamine deamidase CheD [Ramlibacter sp.]|uniref:chemoreceptor glutamine deamidase CheD n=1 Tax=Ramlibacter sp. TaxID=1917967 RepID=UPI002FCBE733
MQGEKPQRYFDRDFKVESVKILPGQYHAGRGPGSISTVLGSCVSTCLWDPAERIGGMNHFMLPGQPGTAPSPSEVSGRLGVYAMEVLINEMVHAGADRRRLVAKVFGGARVLQGFETLDVGALNSQFVLEFLHEENIPVLAQDLLGISPRKIHFFPDTGKVQMRKLHLQSGDALQREERAYLARLSRQPGAGEIELFEPPR